MPKILAAILLSIQFTSLVLAGGFAESFRADMLNNWHQWRGPFADGFAPHSDPPLHWDESTNIHWKVEIPGNGSSTPVVWGDRIFVLTAIDTRRKPVAGNGTSKDTPSNEVASLTAERGRRQGGRKPGKEKQVLSVPRPTTVYRFEILCLDRDTGDVLWQRTANEAVPYDGHHPTHGYASASPTTDGQRVYASFGSYGIYCYTVDGKFLWQRDLGRMQTRRGFGEAISPVLHGDSLIVNWDHEGDSFIVSLDIMTGDEQWRTARDEETTWGTPLAVEHQGTTQIVTNATGRSRSYDLATGELLWQCGGQVKSPIPSPIARNGIAYCMTGYQGYAINAIPLNSAGDISDSDAIAWHYTDAAPYVSSPLLIDDLLYFTKGATGILLCLDATTGKVVYGPKRLPGIRNLYASLAGAAGKLYVVDRKGVTLVIASGPEFQVLATNTLDESFSASPVIVGNELLLRGQHHLYCIQSD